MKESISSGLQFQRFKPMTTGQRNSRAHILIHSHEAEREDSESLEPQSLPSATHLLQQGKASLFPHRFAMGTKYSNT